MSNALRRVVWGALLACVLAVAGVSSAAASLDTPNVQRVQVAVLIAKKKPDRLCREANALRKAVIKKFTKIYTEQYGKKEGTKHARDLPGRNICVQGMRGGKKPSHGDKVRYRNTLSHLKNPRPAVVTPSAPAAPATPAPNTAPTSMPSGAPSSTLESIASCESGGNPSAVSPGGTYRGKYQFDQQTWESVGGTGDPAAAPEGEQDRRAAVLYGRSGSSPWPVCGH